MVDRNRQAGAELPDIEITPEMIKAGTEVFLEWNEGCEWYDILAGRIFRAMLAARKTAQLSKDGDQLIRNRAKIGKRKVHRHLV